MSEQFKNQTRQERIEFLGNALHSVINEKSSIYDDADENGLINTAGLKRLKELNQEWDKLYNEYNTLRDTVIAEVVN